MTLTIFGIVDITPFCVDILKKCVDIFRICVDISLKCVDIISICVDIFLLSKKRHVFTNLHTGFPRFLQNSIPKRHRRGKFV
jgi:hypothetical protein